MKEILYPTCPCSRCQMKFKNPNISVFGPCACGCEEKTQKSQVEPKPEIRYLSDTEADLELRDGVIKPKKPRTKGELLNSLHDLRKEYPTPVEKEIRLSEELLPTPFIEQFMNFIAFALGVALWIVGIYFMATMSA